MPKVGINCSCCHGIDQEKIPNSERNITIDIFRLFAAFLVVSIHTGIFDLTMLGPYAMRIKTLSVPFFAIVSGYFLSQNHVDNKQSGGGYSYTIRYIAHILLAYLGATLFYYTEHMYAQMYSNHYLSLSLYYLLFAHAKTGHLWYLIAVAILSFLFLIIEFLCEKLNIKKSSFIYLTIAIITIVCYHSMQSYYYLPGNQIGSYLTALWPADETTWWPFWKRVFLRACPYFSLGIVFNHYKEYLYRISKENAGKILIIALSFFTVEQLLIIKFGLPASATNCSTPLYIIAALFIFALRNPTAFSSDPKLGRYCQKMSVYIYYLHTFFNFFLVYVPKFSEFTSGDRFVITLVLSVFVGSILYKINNKYLNYVFC